MTRNLEAARPPDGVIVVPSSTNTFYLMVCSGYLLLHNKKPQMIIILLFSIILWVRSLGRAQLGDPSDHGHWLVTWSCSADGWAHLEAQDGFTGKTAMLSSAGSPIPFMKSQDLSRWSLQKNGLTFSMVAHGSKRPWWKLPVFLRARPRIGRASFPLYSAQEVTGWPRFKRKGSRFCQINSSSWRKKDQRIGSRL